MTCTTAHSSGWSRWRCSSGSCPGHWTARRLRRSRSASRNCSPALKELRELARGIHPAVLTDHGLRAALEALAARSPARWTSPRACRRGWRLALYFVVSEALANTASYARATSARLNARVADGRAEVTVSDDGAGGAPGRAGAAFAACSTASMRSTAASPSTARGQGTTVHAWVPLPPNEGPPETLASVSSVILVLDSPVDRAIESSVRRVRQLALAGRVEQACLRHECSFARGAAARVMPARSCTGAARGPH